MPQAYWEQDLHPPMTAWMALVLPAMVKGISDSGVGILEYPKEGMA